jgi:hypothetical protein
VTETVAAAAHELARLKTPLHGGLLHQGHARRARLAVNSKDRASNQSEAARQSKGEASGPGFSLYPAPFNESRELRGNVTALYPCASTDPDRRTSHAEGLSCRTRARHGR